MWFLFCYRVCYRVSGSGWSVFLDFLKVFESVILSKKGSAKSKSATTKSKSRDQKSSIDKKVGLAKS